MGISRLPFASFFAGTLILTLSACGGQPITFNGNPVPSSEISSSSESSLSDEQSSSDSSSSSSSESSSSSSSSNSSSSVSSSSSSRSSSSSSSSSAPTGKELYASTRLGCSLCHGSTGQGGTSGYSILPEDWDKPTLMQQIASMPPQNEPAYAGVTCDQACASKIADYILAGFPVSASQPAALLKQSGAASTTSQSLLSSGETNCGVAYSNSDLRSLTRQEYSAAIFQLTGIDLITTFGQSTYDALPSDSHTGAILNSDSQESFRLAANKIAGHLSSTNFAAIDCATLSSEQCYSQLIDDFACKAFKRPLTAAERNEYLATYSASGFSKEGIEQVASTILASANFIYRSNIGLSLLNRESSINTTLMLASSAPLLNTSKTLSLHDSTRLNANFSGSDLLEISVKSTQNANGLWPVLRVQIGESTFVDILANQAEATYKFHVTGVTGIASIALANQAANAPLEYQTGHSLVISSIKVALSY